MSLSWVRPKVTKNKRKKVGRKVEMEFFKIYQQTWCWGDRPEWKFSKKKLRTRAISTQISSDTDCVAFLFSWNHDHKPQQIGSARPPPLKGPLRDDDDDRSDTDWWRAAAGWLPLNERIKDLEGGRRLRIDNWRRPNIQNTRGTP